MFSTVIRAGGVVRVGLAALWLWAGWVMPAQGQSRSQQSPLVVDHHEVRDGTVAAAIDRAVQGARRRLSRESCERVLSDFTSSDSRSPHEVMASLGLTSADALSRIIFRDGRDATACRTGRIAAFTGAGSRVVFVCGARFQTFSRDVAERVVIHELLHTLGLSERPPTPTAIDRAVERRCGD